jgi:hypothetical protein
VPVVVWILLGVALLLGYAAALTIVLVRYTRRRTALRPYRVPATVLHARVLEPVETGHGRLELELAVAWPGEPLSTVTVEERTTARPTIPTFEPGMAVSVFMPPDRSWARLDWSRFNDVAGGSKRAIESNDWMVSCKSCGFTRSVWTVGGTHYKAVGDWTQVMGCPVCERLRSHLVWLPRVPEPATGSASSRTR